MHASAVRTFQVVEIDDGDFGLLGSAQRPVLGRDHLRWAMTDVEPLQQRPRVAVAGEKKIHHRLLALRRESDGKVIEPGELAFAGRSNSHVDVRGHFKLRAHQDFYSPVQLWDGDGRSVICCATGGTLRLATCGQSN